MAYRGTPSQQRAQRQQAAKDVSTGRATKVYTRTDPYGNVRVTGGSSSSGGRVSAYEAVQPSAEEAVRQENLRVEAANKAAAEKAAKEAAAQAAKQAELRAAYQKKQVTIAAAAQAYAAPQYGPPTQYQILTAGPTKSNIPGYAPISGVKPSKTATIAAGPVPAVGGRIVPGKEKTPFFAETPSTEAIKGVVAGVKKIGEFVTSPYAAGGAVAKAKRESKTTKEFVTNVINDPNVKAAATLTLLTVGAKVTPQLGKTAATILYGTTAAVATEEFLKAPSIAKGTELGFYVTLPKVADYTISKSKEAGAYASSKLFSEPRPTYPIEGTQLVMSPTFELQREFKPVMTESGKTLGYDVVPKPGQQKFSQFFTAPGVKTIYTESGIPIEIGRPKPVTRPKLIDKNLRDIVNIDYGISPEILARLKPVDYARYLQRKGAIIYHEKVMPELLPPTTQARYIREGRLFTGETKPIIQVRKDISGTEKQIATAHELIHAKTVPAIREILPYSLEHKIPYKLRPTEMLAFAFEKTTTKRGFMANLGTVERIEISRPFDIPKVPEIPKFPVPFAGRQATLIEYGFRRPVTPRPPPMVKRPYKPIYEQKPIEEKPVIRPTVQVTTEIKTKAGAMETIQVLEERPVKKTPITGGGLIDRFQRMRPKKSYFVPGFHEFTYDYFPKTGLTPISGYERDYFIKSIPGQKPELKPVMETKQEKRPSIRVDQLPKIIPIVMQRGGQDQIQIQKQEQIQIPRQEQRQELITEQETRIIPPARPPETPPREPTPFLWPTLTKRESKKKKRLFKAFVRRRGRFGVIGDFETPEAAFKAGRKRAYETAAASFKVTEMGRPVGISAADFRLYRSRKEAGVFIQKPKFRISSPGEKREITFRGIAISRRKKGRGFF